MDVTLLSESQHPLIMKRWFFLADKLENHPELLSIPLKNIQNWLERNSVSDTWALDEWKRRIIAAQSSENGMAELLAFLKIDSEEARQLKSCSPFAGVLTREERDQFTCAWTH